MQSKLRREFRQLERELSVLVARFIRIQQELVDDTPDGPGTNPPTPRPDPPPTPQLVAFSTDFLNAYA